MKHFCVCGNEIADGRYKLGYRTCLDCSSEKKWSGIQIVYHKTGNDIQIVKDPDDAAEFLAKTSRKGFGAMRGMTSSYKNPARKTDRKKPRIVPSSPSQISYVIDRRKVSSKNYKDEEVAKRIFSFMEIGKRSEAENFLENQFQEMRISPIARKQLKHLIENWVR
jgi:hypothetical protein